VLTDLATGNSGGQGVRACGLFRRRRHVNEGPLPLRTVAAFAASIAATLALWVNTLGLGYKPDAAVFVVALTALLLVGGVVFVQNLELFLK
jgi:hypothetical protein